MVNHFYFNSTSTLKYWSQERSTGADCTLLIAEDENEAYNWLVGP